MKPEPCRCDARPYPHRRDEGCAEHEIPPHLYERDRGTGESYLPPSSIRMLRDQYEADLL
jgi:hypothetical protein